MKFDVAYVYSFKDYRSFFRANHQRQPVAWLMSYVSLVLLGAILRIWPQQEPLFPDFSGLSWTEGACELIRHPIVWVAIWLLFVRFVLIRLAYLQLPVRGKSLHYAIGGNGILWTRSDGPTGHYPWGSFSEMTSLRDGSALVLWLARHEALVLPVRGFKSSEELEQARAFIAEKMDASSLTS